MCPIGRRRSRPKVSGSRDRRHSFVSGVTIEDTLQAIGDPDRLWAQTTLRTEEENEAYRRRVAKLGIKTLIIAAETVGSDRRERDLHNGLATMPPRPPVRELVDFALHLRWVLRWLTGPSITFADHTVEERPVRMSEMYSFIGQYPRPDWPQLQRLRDAWDGRLVVKGIGTPEDALMAVDLGADAIVVSNLGGRHFDGQPSTIKVLPGIVDAVRGIGSDIDIIVDGGMRRGSDIVRALALGATAAAAGRSFGYGIAVAGQEGAEKAFSIYREEFTATMESVGAPGARRGRGIDAGVRRRARPGARGRTHGLRPEGLRIQLRCYGQAKATTSSVQPSCRSPWRVPPGWRPPGRRWTHRSGWSAQCARGAGP